MQSSAIYQAPPIYVVFYCPCDKVYHNLKYAFFCIY